MKSTLYLKFIFIYIIFGFLSLFTAATLTENLVRTPIFNRISNSMYREATMVATSYLPGYFSGELQESDTQMILSGIETQLDAAVWFVSRDGNMIASAHSSEYPSAPDTIKDFDPAESGSDRSQTGDYHGYFDNDVITVTVPVTYGYFPKGYLMIHQYTTVVDTMTDILMRGVYITLIVLFLLSFIILLAFHFLVYRPLHKITEAATQYASGNLEYEIPVTTEDEMGYLSASLNYMSSQLRDMEDYQKKFVANVSHDFRSPLTSIKGYVEAMTDGTIPPELHEKYLKIILFETERLTDLTHDLLTLNEFDTNHLLLNREVFDIHEMIKHVAASFEGVCTQKKISIELVFATKHLNVNADKRKIQQVLYNLLDNAIKFSDPDSKVNAYETEAMQELLEKHGYEIVPFQEGADVYIINTCTVTNMADRKSRQMLHRARKMNPDSIVVACGCYVQARKDDIPDGIDIVIGNNKKQNIVEILENYEKEKNPDAQAKGHFDRVNAAVYELLTSSDEMSREVLEEQARKWNVCPFEMALDVSQWVDASECIQKRVVKYDKTGDNHYDTISAFIKSMRGSDPDAAVYYLAKMLYAGEDTQYP